MDSKLSFKITRVIYIGARDLVLLVHGSLDWCIEQRRSGCISHLASYSGLSAVAGDAAGKLEWQVLRKKNWCKPLKSPGDRSLPGWRPADRFYAPQEIRPAADAAAVSGACALLEGEPSAALKKCLGWDRPPQVGVLTRQIEKLRNQASLYN